MNLRYCKVTFPDLDPSNGYDGAFVVDGENISFWIIWNNAEQNKFEQLFKLGNKREYFNAILVSDSFGNETFSCFNCFFPIVFMPCHVQEDGYSYTKLTPCDNERFIEVRCNSWIEHKAIRSLDELCWKQVVFSIPFSEPWFPNNKNTYDIDLSQHEKIHFFIGLQEEYKAFPYSYTKKPVCQIVYEKNDDFFSINDTLEISLLTQCLLRFSSKIAFPRAIICFTEQDKYGLSKYRFHGKYGLSGIKDYASAGMYSEMPETLLTLINKNVIANWYNMFRNKNLLNSVVNYCKCQDQGSINDNIVSLVKVFDKLSRYQATKETKMSKSVFSKWLNKVAKYGEEQSESVFNRDRIKSVLGAINNSSLEMKLASAFEQLNGDYIKSKADTEAIAKYCYDIRNADSHSAYFDITDLPNGYEYLDILKIIDEADRRIINKIVNSISD